MKTKKLRIKINKPDESPAEAFKRETIEEFKQIQKKGKLHHPKFDIVFTFPNTFWLNKILSPERMRIYQTIREKKPESIYQLAKLLGRTIANVQRDVHELAELGIIELKRTHKKGQKKEMLCPEYHWDGFDIAV